MGRITGERVNRGVGSMTGWNVNTLVSVRGEERKETRRCRVSFFFCSYFFS